MARRRKTSLLEDLMEIAAHLPWQAGVALALVSYLVLHHFAVQLPLPTHPDALKAMEKTFGDLAASSIWTAIAGVLQYVVPFAFLVGAGVSFVKRRRQGELHGRVAADSSADALDKMTWRDFEGLVAETFRQKGYRVFERGGDGPDGGVDLEAHQGRDKYLIQCKQWKARQVGVATVRELYGVITAEGAVGGFVVASGSFTADAVAFAEGRSIRLVDARGLRRMIDGVEGSVYSQAPAPRPDAALSANPACPKCGSAMVRRTAKSGRNAGNEFWGCAKYPSCRGVRN